MPAADNKTLQSVTGTFLARMRNLANWAGATGADMWAMVCPVVTEVPTVLASPNTLSVPTTAGGTLLSTISGGIPAGATHALMSVPAGGGNIVYTEDGVTAPTTTVGLLVPAGDVAELTNLASINLISTSGSVLVYFSFRKYK